ncbi:MAG: hypothetical protein CL928_07205 [Deltaproteobacteria bacterium]|nr:hypothetical protein [Deltaproteobacteria bacterium]
MYRPFAELACPSARQRPVVVPGIERVSIGAHLPGRFRDIEPLGQGGAGTVYRAFDELFGFEVALKIPFLDQKGHMARSLAVELQAAAALRHPNIIQVLDSGTIEDDQPYLVIEYADRGSLDSLVEAASPWQELKPILLGVLAGLGHAHTRGIVHRDIKIENILLSSTSEGTLVPKVADLGMAKLLQRKGLYSDTRVGGGTLLYMPPEQFESELAAVHPTADFYSFGVLVYSLVTGRLPWDFDGIGALIGAKNRGEYRPMEPRDVQQVPRGLADVVDRLLAVQPMERFHLAADVQRALEDLDRFPLGSQTGSRGMAVTTGRPLVPRALQDRIPGVEELVRFPVTPALTSLRSPRFVGRVAEREMLWTYARECFRRPQGLCLTGAPGVGRTRLASWLGGALEQGGLAQTVRIRLEANSGVFEAMTQCVRNLLGLGSLQGDRLTEKLGGWVSSMGHQHESDLNLLFRGLEASGEGGGGEKALGVAALWPALLVRLLQTLSQRGLAYLFVEDQTPAGLAGSLAGEILRQAQAQPFPLLIVYEPRVVDPQRSPLPDGFEERPIGPMHEEQIRELVGDLLPHSLIGPDFIARLQGNPRVAVTAARLTASRHLEDEGPDGDGDTWSDDSSSLLSQSVVDAEQVFLPTMSLDNVAAARVDEYLARSGAPEAAQAVLVAAAHLPAPVDESLLLDAVAEAEDVDGLVAGFTLHEAVQAGLLQPDTEGRLSFSDPALREDALERGGSDLLLVACARVLLRGDAVTVARRLCAGRLLLVAGEREEGLSALIRGAESALAFEVASASVAFGEAIALCDELGVDSADDRRVRAVLGAARAARDLGDAGRAASILKPLTLRSLAGAQGAEVETLEASLYLMRGQPGEALVAARSARATCAELGDQLGVARCALLEGQALEQKRDLEGAGEAFDRAQSAVSSLAEPAPHLEGQCLLSLGHNLRLRQRVDEAARCFHGALDLARVTQDPSVKGVALREIASLDLASGRYLEAERHLRDAVDCLEAAGLRGETATTRLTLGELAHSRGELPVARTEYSVALGVARAYGLNRTTWLALTNLAVTEVALGRMGRVRRRLTEIESMGLTDAPDQHQPYFTVLSLLVKAEARDWAAAEDMLSSLETDALELPRKADFIDLLGRVGMAACDRGETPLAMDAWTLAMTLAERAGDTERLQSLRELLSGLGA